MEKEDEIVVDVAKEPKKAKEPKPSVSVCPVLLYRPKRDMIVFEFKGKPIQMSGIKKLDKNCKTVSVTYDGDDENGYTFKI